MYVQVSERGTITIPKELRVGLDKGSLLEVVRREDGVIELHPRIAIDPSQAWFWTPEWQQKEREADEDIAAGRVSGPMEFDEFLAELDRVAREADEANQE